jgi:hypothetical protein
MYLVYARLVNSEFFFGSQTQLYCILMFVRLLTKTFPKLTTIESVRSVVTRPLSTTPTTPTTEGSVASAARLSSGGPIRGKRKYLSNAMEVSIPRLFLCMSSFGEIVCVELNNKENFFQCYASK